MFAPGSPIGPYRVVRALGRGRGDGLFQVEDLQGQPFAIRAVVADSVDDGPPAAERFLPDAKALQSLQQLNIVPMFEAFVEKGYLFVVTEHVRGRTLAQAITEGQIPPRDALVIIRQVLAAAAAAHAGGIVHRELEPSRVLLVPMQGWELVKVADFGLASIRDEAVLELGTGVLPDSPRVGPAAYMAPEQVRGRSVDQRTDLYAIGSILFEMIAGRAPFPDSDPQLVMQMQMTQPAPRLDELFGGEAWVTPELIEVLATALSKDRETRYQSASQMNQGIEAAFRSLGA